jgi:hypothetical protein
MFGELITRAGTIRGLSGISALKSLERQPFADFDITAFGLLNPCRNHPAPLGVHGVHLFTSPNLVHVKAGTPIHDCLHRLFFGQMSAEGRSRQTLSNSSQ